MKSEIRKDYIQEKYVIIAPKRGKRPHDTIIPKEYQKKKQEKLQRRIQTLENS